MKDSVRSIFQKIYYAITANLLNLLISLLVSFGVPKLLGLEEYGYWQLYIFYVGYVGFFHFGLADGVYLRYGGQYYDDIDKSLMHSQYWLLVIFEAAVFIAIGVLAVTLADDGRKGIILVASGLNCVLLLPRTVLLYLLQSTGRVKEYARNLIAERVVYLLLIMIFLAYGFRRFEFLLLGDICAKTVAMFSIAWLCRDIVWARRIRLSSAILEFWKNISAGIKLLFANIAGMLIIGIIRFGIERNWEIATFGKVSFSLSISHSIIVFISAVGIVFFPIIKRSDPDKLPLMYDTFGGLLSGILTCFLIFYFPIRQLLALWLPQYGEAIDYLAILFPICMFEARSSMLINTYLKALREERAMLLMNLCSVIVSMATTAVVVFWLEDLTLTIMSMVFLYMFKCVVPDLFLQKKMKMEYSVEWLWQILITVIFISSNWYVGGIWGWTAYVLCMLGIGFVRREEYRRHLQYMKAALY
ncbi:MAG: hypothetical protein JXP48_14765 [Acidobacteria bacterium]|nr:hypothetical protein [Acidobacteriota bacterium]